MSDTNVSTATAGFLHISEERSRLESMFGDYDLFIGLASWESRGIAVSTMTKITAKKGLIFNFHPSHASDAVILEAQGKMRDGLSGRVSEIEAVNLARSTEYPISFKLLTDRVEEYCRLKPHPMIAIDISSIPIGYLQGLVGFLFNRGLTPFIDCYYVEPKYEIDAVSPPGQAFTEGNWQLVPAPYLEGKPKGQPSKCIFVCIGAESDNTRELLLSREYSETAIVKPSHGSLSAWNEQIDHDCDELVSALNVVGDQYKSVKAFSVVSVVNYYLSTVYSKWRESQRVFVAIGTKPHGLAGVVCGLADPELSILARIPRGYHVRDVCAGEYVWRYKLRDLSSSSWAIEGFPDWE